MDHARTRMPKSVPSLEINASIIGPLKGCQHETAEAVQKDNLSNEGQNKITASVKKACPTNSGCQIWEGSQIVP